MDDASNHWFAYSFSCSLRENIHMHQQMKGNALADVAQGFPHRWLSAPVGELLNYS